MVLGFLKSNVAPIAIDFGFSDVKVLQVAPGEPPVLQAAASVEIPEAVRPDPAARLAFVGDALPRLLREGNFKGRLAMCSIPAWQTFVQHMQVPRKPEGRGGGSDIGEQLKTQLQAVIACDPSNVVVRHVEVCDVFRENAPMTEVICFAVARDVVMRWLDLIKKCRLELAGFHAEPVAIVKAFDHIHRRDGDQNITTLFVDVGTNSTKAMIAHGGTLKFAKSIPVGGRHFDQRLAEALNCDLAAARGHRLAEVARTMPSPAERVAAVEAAVAGAMLSQSSRLAASAQAQAQASNESNEGGGGAATAVGTAERRRPGGVPRTLTACPADGGATAAQGRSDAPGSSLVRDALADLTEQLLEELRMCVRYHGRLFEERSLDRVIFVGGESRDRELCRAVAERLGVSAYLGDPMGRLKRGGGETVIGPAKEMLEHPGWAVPLGLCACPMDG